MTEPSSRAILQLTYARLREKLDARDVSPEHLREAALEALEKAKVEIELDPDWVAQELERLRAETP